MRHLYESGTISKGVQLFSRVHTLLFCLGLLLFASACHNEAESGRLVEEIRPEQGVSNADLIRNPVSAEKSADTTNVPQISFDHTNYDFGEIPGDQMVSHVFEFENTGKSPLVIAHARGTCGCTVPQWPKDPVPPGGKGEIEVRFDPTGREGQQSKPVTITANTYPNTTTIFISARVKPQAD